MKTEPHIDFDAVGAAFQALDMVAAYLDGVRTVLQNRVKVEADMMDGEYEHIEIEKNQVENLITNLTDAAEGIRISAATILGRAR